MSQPSSTAPAPPDEREVEAAIKSFLAGYHPNGARGAARIAGARNLWQEINSLTLLELVAYVEQKFAITVRPIDFAPQNFSSIDAIAQFVVRRRS
ncbi:MAG TPA: acyl carrier protein [Kofleriaceae bacterium]|nr:acyl carrier protein [Kofleriaceae bacterium]